MTSKNKIIKSHAALKKIVLRLQKKGKKVAFTNGCFDILHFGHVSYLEEAKKPGRILIVGLNSDTSVRKIKGPKRPIVGQSERARVMAGLVCVDYVTIFNEETPYNLIKILAPDILIKGADWKGKKVAGADIVSARGGKVEFIKYVKHFSTTNIIKAIAAKCAK